jgi:hypothetical protein
VYNTETNNDVTPGYYFWSGTAWIRLSVSNGTSGTTNYVTKWTADCTLGNSQLFDDGTNVGIGTTSPSEVLDVNGNARLSRENAELNKRMESMQAQIDVINGYLGVSSVK